MWSQDQGNGVQNSFTLATRLAQMLIEAEAIFGLRDQTYTIVGIELRDSVPHIWYPGRDNFVCIRLSYGNRASMNALCYELAHETVHCLSPNPHKRATVLEEGMATWFADWIAKKHFGSYVPRIPDDYQPFLDAYQKLLAIKEDAVKEIRLGRKPQIWEIEAEDIKTTVPGCPDSLAEELVTPS